MAYVAVFVITWFFGLLNRTVQMFDRLRFWCSVLHAIFVPSQGLMNAVIFGGVLEADSPLVQLFCGDWLQSIVNRLFSMRLKVDEVVEQENQLHAQNTLLSSSEARDEEIQHGTVRMFLSTLNLGECLLDKLGDLTTWIPPGYDLYAIGVQECLCLDELRRLIHDLLGGPVEYTMYCNEIGSTNTTLGFHGFIALTVFVKTRLVESGAISKTDTATKEVKKGVNLVVTRAANKGTVGLPFQIYDQSVAFLTAHFASDNRGRSKKEKRNNDARSMLQDIVLQPEDVGCDMQFEHDHVFLLGDLNYRMAADPRDILSYLVAATTLEYELSGKDANWLMHMYQRDFFGFEVGVKRDTPQMTQMAAQRWERLLQYDELRMVMSANEVFTGFKEMPAHFPPSYRRKKGHLRGDCGDYTDLQRLYSAYTTNVEEDNTTPELKGMRPPSYTDRIIFHSLPDQEHLLRPAAYLLCDSLRGSDHRPVSMVCDLIVNKTVTLSTVATSLVQKCSVISLKMTALSADLKDASEPTKGKEAAFQSASASPASSPFVDLDEPNHLKMDVLKNAEHITESAPLDKNVHKLIVVFPLPSEDPLMFQRKVHDVARALGVTYRAKGHTVERLLIESRHLSNTASRSSMSLTSEFKWTAAIHTQLEVH
jgi:hypothetical protein